jgi:putative ABC transport system permease protein
VSAIRLDVGVSLAAAMLALVLIAAAVAHLTGIVPTRSIVTAAARATIQLAVVSAVIAAIVKNAGWTLVFLAFMFTVAIVTAGRRVSNSSVSRRWAAVPILVAVVPIVAGLVIARVVPTGGITLVPVTGILIGGAMTATSLAGRRTLDELAVRRGEVEAAIAVGLTDRDARWEICGPVAGQALVPGMDQTRTVGLVTLPGAFVGMLLGGATAIEAGAVQLFVLVALLAVQVVAVAVTGELVARGQLRRDPARSAA